MINKIGLLLIIFYGGSFNINAQSKITYGPRLGLTILPVEKNEDLGSNFKLGVNGGLFFNYQFSRIFSVRPELNYQLKKQFQTSFDTTDILNDLGGLIGIDPDAIGLPAGINLNAFSTTKNLQRLHYIEVPVLVTAHLSNVKISAGPYFGVLFAANTKSVLTQDIPVLSLVDLEDLLGSQGNLVGFFLNTLFPGYNEPSVDNTKGTSAFNTLDIGAVVDVTYQLDNNLNFGFRYQQGFIDYRKTTINDKVFNSSIQFLLGYRFGKGKAEGPIRKPHVYDGN